MQESFIKKYFFAIVLLAALILGFFLFLPFLTTIIMSVVLTVLFHPLYRRIHTKIKSPSIASLLTVVIFIIVVCIPVVFIATVVFNQAQDLYTWIVSQGALDGLMIKTNAYLSTLFPGINLNIETSAAAIVSRFVNGVGSIFSVTLTTIFSFLLVILSMFYFLKDGASWKGEILALSPLSVESNKKIIERMHQAIHGITRGYLLVGLAQGTLMGIGLFIFGVPHAALWAVFAAIASMVPTIGTAFVAIPAILFLVITGQTGAALGMAAWAVVIVGTIDNLLNPIVIGKSIDIHPLLILFAVLGGVALLGPIGIVIGPLIISLIYALLSVATTELYLQ